MKILLPLLMMLPFIGRAQEQDATAIKISGLSVQQLVKGLLQSGYDIHKSEGSLNYIFTAPKKLGQNIFTQLKAEIQKDCVILYGGYVNKQDDDFHAIAANTVNQEMASKSWDELRRLAGSFNKPLEYLKRR